MLSYLLLTLALSLPSPSEAKTEHQRQVLSRLSHNQPQREEIPNIAPSPPRSPTPHTFELRIPSPQVHLLDKWECAKSVSSTTAHSTVKQHSCQDPPPIPPPPPPPPSSPPPLLSPSISTTTIAFQSAGVEGAIRWVSTWYHTQSLESCASTRTAQADSTLNHQTHEQVGPLYTLASLTHQPPFPCMHTQCVVRNQDTTHSCCMCLCTHYLRSTTCT